MLMKWSTDGAFVAISAAEKMCTNFIQSYSSMKVNYKSFNLPFKYPFTISKGTKTQQPTFIAELDFNGIKGYGEAPAITYYNITVEKMIADLEAKKNFVEKYALMD